MFNIGVLGKFVLEMFFNIGLYGKCTFQFVRIIIEFVLGMFVLAWDNSNRIRMFAGGYGCNSAIQPATKVSNPSAINLDKQLVWIRQMRKGN